ncbi:MAG TPA: hypothetical protein VFL93_04735 [Longimicrobiaceae bacterium]|nr:hypothetical protein [Longimicrobiaceae bacterium]
MPRALRFAPFALALALCAPRPARAQAPDWRPPSKQMPAMPRASDLRGNWLAPLGAWFRGIDGISGVPNSSLRAGGETRSGSDVMQVVRFTNGPLPVVVWSDRNGDGRADMIDIYRRGGVIIQVIDPDYNGSADVMRIYNADGSLLRQDNL